MVSQTIADPGERVQPGQPIMVINDPRDVWVSANIEETAIRKVQVGQPVEIEADAYPQRRFHGTVSQLGAATRSEFAIIPTASASAHFIKVTQRIPVRIAVDNARVAETRHDGACRHSDTVGDLPWQASAHTRCVSSVSTNLHMA